MYGITSTTQDHEWKEACRLAEANGLVELEKRREESREKLVAFKTVAEKRMLRRYIGGLLLMIISATPALLFKFTDLSLPLRALPLIGVCTGFMTWMISMIPPSRLFELRYDYERLDKAVAIKIQTEKQRTPSV